MTTTYREVERKYDASEDAQVPEWPELVEFGSPEGPQDDVLRAAYYDTADFRLLQAGVTLRHRTGGDDAGWHLKLPVGPSTRDEIRVADARKILRAPSAPPVELRKLTRSVTRGAALKPIATITTARRRWRWTDDDGHLVLEVVDDRVTAQRADAGAEPGTWREIEVELGPDGDPGLLDRMERELSAAGVHRSGSSSKVSRALGATPKAPARSTASLKAKSSVGDVVLAYVGEQAAAIVRLDPYVRRDTLDAVHQMRVATRRMRSALQVFGTVIERDATRNLTDELKWLAGVLGEARDLEVLRTRVTDAVASLPDEDVLGPVQARVTKFFARREATARKSLVAALDGARYLALLDAVDHVLAYPPLTSGASRRASKELPDLLERGQRRIARHLRAAARGERDVELHEARKSAKRLRYAAEASTPVLGRPAGVVVERVKGFQDLLGEHQDAVVALPMLRQLAIDAQLEGENAFTFGLLYGRDGATDRLPERDVAQSWGQVRKAMRRLPA